MSQAASVQQTGMLEARIAQLCRDGCPNLLETLRAEATDPQGLVDELGALLRIPPIRMQELSRWEPCLDQLAFAEVVRRRCALLTNPQGQLQLVVTDPFDTDLMAWAITRFGQTPISLASAESFDAWLANIESEMTALGSLAASAPSEASSTDGSLRAESLTLRGIGADDSPAVRFVNSTLYDALRSGASDIHLESDAAGMNVKFRLDGVLTLMQRLDSVELALQSISRIKVMAQLDIAERRVPQDGRLQIAHQGRPIDVRVSIMPSIHGEDAVLRILDRQHLAQSLSGLTLAKLGFDDAMGDAIRKLCRKPHGMLLITGPTGSGKTTTLYAAITETHQSRDKIITIEDPVEYQLPGVLQIPVNERKGLTFARGLRSILRHDPDKILVGEIRDAETAQIAVQSALTGHLVFTTVHANTVFDVVSRFEQFGIDAYTFASAINGVMAQRLLRRLCVHCARAEDGAAGSPPLMAVGCERCRGTGYAGRFALGELMILSPSVKALVARRALITEIQEAVSQEGWRSLREQALDAVAAGVTSLEEVDRVAS